MITIARWPRASHLDAVQGSNEERAKRIQTYVEQAPKAANAVMRQEPPVHPPQADSRAAVRRA